MNLFKNSKLSTIIILLSISLPLLPAKNADSKDLLISKDIAVPSSNEKYKVIHVSSVKDSINITALIREINELKSKELDIERDILLNKQSSYDSALNTLIWIAALFGIMFTAILMIAAILGYKSIQDTTQVVKRKMEKLDEAQQNLIKKTVESLYEDKINQALEIAYRLENYIKDLTKVVRAKNGKKIPPYVEEDKVSEKPSAKKENIFEET